MVEEYTPYASDELEKASKIKQKVTVLPGRELFFTQ